MRDGENRLGRALLKYLYTDGNVFLDSPCSSAYAMRVSIPDKKMLFLQVGWFLRRCSDQTRNTGSLVPPAKACQELLGTASIPRTGVAYQRRAT